MTEILRTCAIGGQSWLAHDSTSYNGAYMCPKHLRLYMAGFNPRIRDSVRFIDGYGNVGWTVVARNGMMVTLRKIGFPHESGVNTHVDNLCPGGYGHVYSHPQGRRCGKS